MKRNLLYRGFAQASVLLCLAGCSMKEVIKPELSSVTLPTETRPDFSVFISIGDSQTAGQSNDGLYREAQINSFPNIISQQFAAVGGGNFYQPLFETAQANGTGYLKLNGFNPDGSAVITKVTDKLAVRGTSNGLTLLAKHTGNVSNFGVTGISLADINDAGYGNKNPYFERLLTGVPPNNTTSYLDFVTAKPYTFFTCWLGNNDVLAYATSGGTIALPTDKAIFNGYYTSLINRLTAKGQKGAVANITDVTYIPYFNTITINSILANIRKAIPAADLYINARNSTSLIDTTHKARVATADDLLPLSIDISKIGQIVVTASGPQPYGLSPLAPIANKDVLDANEVAIVCDYIGAYNTTIVNVASQKKLALFDVNALSNLLKQGQTTDGVTVSAAYITGGVFSLDGVHLTPRGYALEANEFIKAINTQYGTNIKTVNIAGYPGLLP